MDRKWKTWRMEKLEGIYETMEGINLKEGHCNVERMRVRSLSTLGERVLTKRVGILMIKVAPHITGVRWQLRLVVFLVLE
jgi:hypothetical protein